jgi:putative addiction module component (TIGR02574 family)
LVVVDGPASPVLVTASRAMHIGRCGRSAPPASGAPSSRPARASSIARAAAPEVVSLDGQPGGGGRARRGSTNAVGRRRAARYTEAVMTAAAKQIFEAALKLDAGERERLAEALWQSIEDQGDVDAAWAEEIKQRIAAADAGQIDSTPWDEARDELLDELKQIHSRAR